MAYGMLVMAVLAIAAFATLVHRPSSRAPEVLDEPMSGFLEPLPEKST
jgi:hypothetical protein